MTTTSDQISPSIQEGSPLAGSAERGALIMNADDWGRDRENTDRTFDCVRCGAVSSVSAMVFMEDSERAAKLTRERGVDTGLHLNFTTQFTGTGISDQLKQHQDRAGKFLKSHRLAQVMFHPGLARSFRYLVAAQIDEYRRLYDSDPKRIDGHHHMHLCANVMFGGLLPRGTAVRRNFSFEPGEKGLINRGYRHFLDRHLARHHRLTDFFFSLPPLQPIDRLKKIFSLAAESVVEVETHPVKPDEYRFLTGEEFPRLAGNLQRKSLAN